MYNNSSATIIEVDDEVLTFEMRLAADSVGGGLEYRQCVQCVTGGGGGGGYLAN